ncbi:hypothetical protein HDU96_009635 [Phlyctochytrium bullatum]|nr:hypothetical protein HDU96_009635 [Phlyctochytrium bullatum]
MLKTVNEKILGFIAEEHSNTHGAIDVSGAIELLIQKRNEMEIKLTNAQEEISRLTEDLMQQRQSMEEKLAAAKKEIEYLTEKCIALEKLLDSNTARLSELEVKMPESQTPILPPDDAQKVKDSKSASDQTLESWESLNERFRQKEELLAFFETSVDILNKELSDLHSLSITNDQERKDAQARLRETEMEKEVLSSELQKARGKLDQSYNEQQSILKKLSSAEDQIDSLLQQRLELSMSLDKSTETIQKIWINLLDGEAELRYWQAPGTPEYTPMPEGRRIEDLFFAILKHRDQYIETIRDDLDQLKLLIRRRPQATSLQNSGLQRTSQHADAKSSDAGLAVNKHSGDTEIDRSADGAKEELLGVDEASSQDESLKYELYVAKTENNVLSSEVEHLTAVVELLRKELSATRSEYTGSPFRQMLSPIHSRSDFSRTFSDLSRTASGDSLIEENRMLKKQVESLRIRLAEVQKSSARCLERFKLRETEILGDLDFYRHQCQQSGPALHLIQNLLDLMVESAVLPKPRENDFYEVVFHFVHEILSFRTLLHKALRWRKELGTQKRLIRLHKLYNEKLSVGRLDIMHRRFKKATWTIVAAHRFNRNLDIWRTTLKRNAAKSTRLVELFLDVPQPALTVSRENLQSAF